jgi:hypothetical protein
MKNVIFIIAAGISLQLNAQLKPAVTCPVFTIDVLEGVLNDGISASSTAGEVKSFFPCFTNETPDAGNNCGGIFYKDKDIYVYTGRDYIEVGPNFKGRLTLPLIGASRGSLFKWLGLPKIKDAGWDAFQTKYGTLILYYSKTGKINKLQITNQDTNTIKLCE